MRPFRNLVLQGMSPEAIALSIAVGSVLGIFPVPGCPTLLCALAAVVLRLNGPAIQVVNYLVYPLQLALFTPFMRFGERMFQGPPGSSSTLDLPAVLHCGAWWAVVGVGGAAAHAIAGWLCVSAPAGVLVYLLLAYGLRRSGVGLRKQHEPAEAASA